MTRKRANERTFQGELFRIINKILEKSNGLQFSKITQEEQVGIINSRFADGKLYSAINKRSIVSFELKDTSWDATDELLVEDAITKATKKGYKYCVTGTPRQLVIFKTFEEGTTIYDRKLKIFNISNVRKVDEVLLPFYEIQITPKIVEFLVDLGKLLHGIEVTWDSIDRYFVSKLSSFIIEASESSELGLYNKI